MDKLARSKSHQSSSNEAYELGKNWSKQAKERAFLLQEHLIKWFDDEQSGMQEAIQQSILGTDFSSEDIYFQLSAIKSRLETGDLVHWVDQCTSDRPSSDESRHWLDAQSTDNENIEAYRVTQLRERSHILCIHAGNLPLVGLQDVIAVLLAGHCYTGKISRKDPYLLSSILSWLIQFGWREQIQHWTQNTAEIPVNNYDEVLFAGSESSLSSVRKTLIEARTLDEEKPWLNRIASFSIAYCSSKEAVIEQSKEFMDALMRHGGKGCRSVGVVVSPVGLNELRIPLENAMKNVLEQNGSLRQANTLEQSDALKQNNSANLKMAEIPLQGGNRSESTRLTYKKAYNIAVDRVFVDVGDWMIEEHPIEYVPEPSNNRVVYWVHANQEDLVNLVERFGSALQSIYYVGPKASDVKKPYKYSFDIESIDSAQRPPLYWKPDGIDILRYLCPFII
jgi:hypothetical protein